MQIEELVQDFPLAFMRLNILTIHRYSLSFYLVQGRRNRFPSGGAMEHWQVLLASMIFQEEKFLNYIRSRMAKTVIF